MPADAATREDRIAVLGVEAGELGARAMLGELGALGAALVDARGAGLAVALVGELGALGALAVAPSAGFLRRKRETRESAILASGAIKRCAIGRIARHARRARSSNVPSMDMGAPGPRSGGGRRGFAKAGSSMGPCQPGGARKGVHGGCATCRGGLAPGFAVVLHVDSRASHLCCKSASQGCKSRAPLGLVPCRLTGRGAR